MKKISETLKNDIKALLEKGEQQGYVTQDEILQVFVEPENYIEELDDFYDQVIHKKIDV